RRAYAGCPGRLVDEAVDLRLRVLRPDVRASVRERGYAVREAAEQRVRDLRGTTRTVVLLSHRSRTDVLRDRRTEAQVIGDRPIHTAIPRIDSAGPGIIRVAIGGVEVHLLDDLSLVHERQEEFSEHFVDALRAAGEGDVRELDFDAVARCCVAAGDAANSLRSV